MTVQPDSTTAAASIEIIDPPAGTSASEPYLDVRVSVPASTALSLRRHTRNKLSLDEAASLVVQLYADAPLDRKARVITTEQFAHICETLGFSPQTMDEMVAGIRELARITVGGVRLPLTAEDIAIMHARNATGLSPKEFLEMIWKVMFEAWKNGQIG